MGDVLEVGSIGTSLVLQTYPLISSQIVKTRVKKMKFLSSPSDNVCLLF